MESPLIFVLFSNGKTKKERKPLNVTPKGKTGLRKTESRFGSQVTYWEGTVVSRNIPLSLYTYGLY